MELTPFFSARAEEPEGPPAPEAASEDDEVIENAPESFDHISLPELLICESGVFDMVSTILLTLKDIVLNPICQILGRVATALGFGGTLISGECTINVGGADTKQACREWIQKKRAAIKAKKAEWTKLLLRMYAQRMMDNLVSQTIDWISGQTTGKPQFITNWKAFFGTVTDQAFGEFIANSPFSELCEPFRFSVRVRTQLPGKPPFPRCTLSMVVNNIESFYDNFANGGWLAFEESYYPWNDAFGAWMMTQEAAEEKLAEAKEVAEKETKSGYTPTKTCLVGITDSATGKEKCLIEGISIPSQTKADIASKALTAQLDKTDSYLITGADLKNYSDMIAKAVISRLVKSAINQIKSKSGGSSLYGPYGSGLLKLPEKSDVKDNVELRYSCKSYGDYGETVTCEYDPKGPYKSLEECQKSCKASSYRWSCNSDKGFCMFDPAGQYSDFITCQNNCQQGSSFSTSTLSPSPNLENRFTCTDDGQCIPDANGEFTSMASCTKYCHP